MLHTAFSRGAASSVAASTRSEPVGRTPSLSASRRRNSSALQGASSSWLSSTSKRSRSFAMTSSKDARVTRILGFTSSPRWKKGEIYGEFAEKEKGGRTLFPSDLPRQSYVITVALLP